MRKIGYGIPPFIPHLFEVVVTKFDNLSPEVIAEACTCLQEMRETHEGKDSPPRPSAGIIISRVETKWPEPDFWTKIDDLILAYWSAYDTATKNMSDS